jgi:hypothetical protein
VSGHARSVEQMRQHPHSCSTRPSGNHRGLSV